MLPPSTGAPASALQLAVAVAARNRPGRDCARHWELRRSCDRLVGLLAIRRSRRRKEPLPMLDQSSPKGRILAAALQCAASKSWSDVTLLDIAEAANVSLSDLR